MSVTEEFLAANAQYAATFAKGDLPMPPARRAAILVCMDARIDPAKALGLAEGDAHVIRNAGGVPSTTLSGPWSFPRSCSAPASASSHPIT